MSTSNEPIDPDEPDLVREKARIVLKREQRKSWIANPWRPSERVLDCDRAVVASQAYARTLFDDRAGHLLCDGPKYGAFKAELLRAQKEVMDDLANQWHEFLPRGVEHSVSLLISCLPKVREDLIEYQETWWLRYLDLERAGAPSAEGPATPGATLSASSGTAETGDSSPNVEEYLILSKAGGDFRKITAQILKEAVLVMNTSESIEIGDRLIRNLPSGLRVALTVDDPCFRASVGRIPAHYALKVHRAPPIDTLADAEFWREIRSGFERLSKRQHDELGSDHEHPRWLSGLCSFNKDTDECDCMIYGGLDSPLVSEFTDLATQAAKALGWEPKVDPVEFWLHCLCQDILANGYRKEILECMVGGGIIFDLLASSAGYCSRLAALEERRSPIIPRLAAGATQQLSDALSHSARQQPDPTPGLSPSVAMTKHEADTPTAEVDEADGFFTVYEEIAASSEESLTAIKQRLKAPKRRVLYHDLEHTIWSTWQIRPDDVTVQHINHALYLLARKSKGGVELDPVSCEAYGIDYSRLVTMMRASMFNAGDTSAGPKVPRKPVFRTSADPPGDLQRADTIRDFMPGRSEKSEDAGQSNVEEPERLSKGPSVTGGRGNGPADPKFTTAGAHDQPDRGDGTFGTQLQPRGPAPSNDQKVGDSDDEGTATAREVSNSPPRRVPDIESSRARLDLVTTLARELATIKQDLDGYCTAEGLKAKHPKFVLWDNLEPAEIKELADGMNFATKAYAENLTLRKFGLSSRETLKKDRRKLRGAKKPKPS